jgi:diadenosine tetraphosphate (Ap4A) HIT family hydrolase
MTDRSAAKERTARLKALRETHQETVERTQTMLKEQQAIRKTLRAAMAAGARTIPQIATQSGLPSEQVLWHVMAMKKYDLVREVGKDGDYYEYALAEGDNS